MTPVSAIIRSLRDEPDRWFFNNEAHYFGFIEKKNSYNYISPKGGYVRFCNITAKTGLIEKFRIRRAIKRWEKLK
jgi:hypothetical protein